MVESLLGLIEHLEGKREEERNRKKEFRALKFWCVTTKRKVFEQGFKGMLERILRKRELGLRALLFFEGTVEVNLQKLTLESLKLYKAHRLIKMKNQKFFDSFADKKRLARVWKFLNGWK